MSSDDGLTRCPWCLGSEPYRRYHDEEWGVPTHDDSTHFEFLVLEGAQAGLSWATVLKKREAYRQAYADFDPAVVAEYDDEKVEELLNNPGIIRNRLKVTSSVNNAARFLEVQDEFGSFNAYLWNTVEWKPVVNRWRTLEEIPANTQLSDRIGKDLKLRGFKFVGSTIIYSHLQATGLVNDHLVDCFRHSELAGD